MSDQLLLFKKKIKTLKSLKSLVKTMKILAAINIASYEKSVAALQHYYQTIKWGLTACLWQSPQILLAVESKETLVKRTGAVIFGSDQGMVGQFNDQIAKFAYQKLISLSSEKIIWPVGERVHARLVNYPDLKVRSPLTVPNSVEPISALISQLLDDVEQETGLDQLLIFYNKPISEAKVEPVYLRLLPIDKKWVNSFVEKKWPTNRIPEAINGAEYTFETLIRQYLFTSIIEACAESLAAENACRLASMQVAEKHIDEQLERERFKYHQERQNRIDEELFDVISGFELMRTLSVSCEKNHK